MVMPYVTIVKLMAEAHIGSWMRGIPPPLCPVLLFGSSLTSCPPSHHPIAFMTL